MIDKMKELLNDGKVPAREVITDPSVLLVKVIEVLEEISVYGSLKRGDICESLANEAIHVLLRNFKDQYDKDHPKVVEEAPGDMKITIAV
jgi:hypothetical protein